MVRTIRLYPRNSKWGSQRPRFQVLRDFYVYILDACLWECGCIWVACRLSAKTGVYSPARSPCASALKKHCPRQTCTHGLIASVNGLFNRLSTSFFWFFFLSYSTYRFPLSPKKWKKILYFFINNFLASLLTYLNSFYCCRFRTNAVQSIRPWTVWG